MVETEEKGEKSKSEEKKWNLEEISSEEIGSSIKQRSAQFDEVDKGTIAFCSQPSGEGELSFTKT